MFYKFIKNSLKITKLIKKKFVNFIKNTITNNCFSYLKNINNNINKKMDEPFEINIMNPAMRSMLEGIENRPST